MKSVKFADDNIEIAKNQPEYNTVFADISQAKNAPCKLITLCFELTDAEAEEIFLTKKVWYQQLGNQMSPMSIHVSNPLE